MLMRILSATILSQAPGASLPVLRSMSLRRFVVDGDGIADRLAVKGKDRREVSVDFDGSRIEEIELIFQARTTAARRLRRRNHRRCLDTESGAAKVGNGLPLDVPVLPIARV